MPDQTKPPFLKHAINDGLVKFSGEGKNERIHYVDADHTERWADPEEKVRAEFWAELIYKYEYNQKRIRFEVKVDKLLGAVSKFGAQEGLFVSWSGFKQNVFKEMAPSFFKVRLWTRNELLAALFENYDRLDEDLKAELPLKRIWTVAAQEEE